MAECVCPPITVEGDWTSAQTRTVLTKLEVYFGSRRKSGGGECRVEADSGAPRAAVFFCSAEARQRVLDNKHHEIVVEKQIFPLRLSSAAVSADPDGSPEPAAVSKNAIVLGNIQTNMSRDHLSMLVEKASGLDESQYSLEVIWESNAAVVTFNMPADVRKFESCQKLQSQRLTARLLEEPLGVRVEQLPPTVVKDMLEMYFEETWSQPDAIVMIAEEQAANISFSDPEVINRICIKQNHAIKSTPVKVYPYYQSLGSALYGPDRPTCQPPKAFTEEVQHAIWRFLLLKKLSQGLNDQMTPYFCSVDLKEPQVKLSPLPSLMRQPGVTSDMVEEWKKTAVEAFRKLLSHYVAFECTITAEAWQAVEKDVRSLVKEDAALVVNGSADLLTVAGPADFIQQIRAPVEKIVNKVMSQIQRETETVQKDIDLSPPMFHLLKQEGLEKAGQDVSPDMSLSYNGNTQKLVIAGVPDEIFRIQDWIYEKKIHISSKKIGVSAGVLNFLMDLDPLEISHDLFTSQGINAMMTVDKTGVSLWGGLGALNKAETKISASLSQQTIVVDDQQVLQLPEWTTLNQQLLETYNSSRKKTVTIQKKAEGGASIVVAGFQTPVEETSRNLQEFIFNFSRVQETLRLKSQAVFNFVMMKKNQELTSIREANFVQIDFDPKKPKMTITGARIHVQKAKSHLQDLTSALASDRLVINKPGAKKYFISERNFRLSSLMTDLNCVVQLVSEDQEEEQEDDVDSREDTVVCHYKVQTASGVLVSVNEANICRLRVDAVVNPANKDLQHGGGLALALCQAAGRELQTISDDYIKAVGALKVGDAIVTGGCNLPCKHVVHAVGPRFSDYDLVTSVKLLKKAVHHSLRKAVKVKCTSVALPAISSGVFGFPVRLCADTIAEAVREFCDGVNGTGSLTQILLVDNNGSTVRELTASVQSVFLDLKPILTPVQPEEAGAVASGFQGGEGSSSYPEGQAQSGPLGHVAQRSGGAEAGGATAEPQGGRKQHPLGSSKGGSLRQITAEGLEIILWKGNIEDQKTCVIVNTIAENLNLKQGAVSKALLSAAGSGLQSAVRTAGGRAVQFGDVVVTNGFKLSCKKVFHAICPFWDTGAAKAENDLTSIVRYCLDQAEKQGLQSLSFPAIGTGNLNFPRDLVCRILLKEISRFSSRRASRHLEEVFIVVHPSDAATADLLTKQPTISQSFFKEFTTWRPLNDLQDRDDLQAHQSAAPSSAFSRVSSPSLGVYHMQMGQVSLEVSSGDITKEASDVIVNSSNQSFDLKTGVSKAILESAGSAVESECAELVKYHQAIQQRTSMILTSAGKLPSKHIVHVVVISDPVKIKDIVISVLKLCEENKFSSVTFPALGTGQGGVDPAAAANAMVEGVVDFLKKKPKFVHSIKILVFQTAMMAEFHRSMTKREGEQVQEKSFMNLLKGGLDYISGKILGRAEEQPAVEPEVFPKEEFEPTVFLLCAENHMALVHAKQRITELIVAEHAVQVISDQYISQLSQDDMNEISSLQKQLTVSISLERGGWDQEPSIRLEGLTRDVFHANAELRSMIHRVQRAEEKKFKAKMISEKVQWYFQRDVGTMVPFDLYTNLQLEEALDYRQHLVKVKISNQPFHANVTQRRAMSADGQDVVELQRKDMKAAVPPEWEDMQGDLVKRFPLPVGSPEYVDVENRTKKTGLQANIISIERVQNSTLWQSYQLMKKQMELKNKHKNNERRLFHGTDAKSLDFIDKGGFDRSFAGTHAAVYGKGTYFAVDPQYSATGYAPPDASGQKRMYLARVLVGDYAQGKGTLITPPNKGSGNSTDLYDSVTDNLANPTMFIVFRDNQAYPEYLITFQ